MAGTNQTQYVDADRLKLAILNIHIASYYSQSYTTGLDAQIGGMISASINQALMDFKMQIVQAIDSAAKPYDKCLLCVQRDSCIPEHPLGDNR